MNDRIRNLLKRENIGAQSHAVPFIPFDRFGDIGDGNTARELNCSKVVVVDGDQSGVILAGFEPYIVGQIVT